jgi:hypothetical protein
MIKILIKKLIPHVCIILALVALTFLVLEQFNPLLGRPFFQVILLLFCIAAITTSAFLIVANSKKKSK